MLRTKNGVIIAAFMNMRKEDWRWNKETHDADPNAPAELRHSQSRRG